MLSHPRLATLACIALLALTAISAYAAGSAHQSAAQATRTVLAQAVDPTGGRGRTLALSRVTISAHTRLGLHRHPGTQVAYIQRGTLTYTVRTGAVDVYRGAADQNPSLVRRVAAGQTGTVHTGEWVIERPRDVHFGANKTGRPIVILLATLFKNGSPLRSPSRASAAHGLGGLTRVTLPCEPGAVAPAEYCAGYVAGGREGRAPAAHRA